MDKKIAVGYTKKPFGVEGELRLSIEPEYLEDTLQAKILFIEVRGNPAPYFVEAMRFNNTPIVKFEDINSKEAARELSSSKVLLFEKDLIPEAERVLEVEELAFEKYVGFEIIDEIAGKVGKIERIEEFPQQEMAIVMYNNKEVMIPMNDQLIKKIDSKKQQIEVHLPEGLLSL